MEAVMRPQVLLPPFQRAKSKPGKATGSARIGRDTGATEDAAWRRFAAAGREDDGA
jgi:hypothetical protein